MGQRLASRLVLAVLLVAIVGGRARAQQPDDAAIRSAKIHYEAGEQYYLRGRYEDAIREFEEAYRLSGRAALLYNIAQAYERLGDLPRTRDFLQRYLDSGAATPEETDAIGDKLKLLDERIQRTNETPVTQPAGTPATKEPPASGPATPATTTPPPQAAPPAAPRPFQVWKWVGLGAGGALLLASAGFAIDASRMESQIEDAEDPTRAWDLQDEWNRGRRDRTLAWVCGGLGVAAAAAGTVLYVLDGRSGEAGPGTVAVAPLLAPDVAGANVSLRW